MSDRPSVELLLASYNNEAYVAELMQSLARQTYSDFTLIVSDDCSQDRTLSIIEEHASTLRNPVRVLRRTSPSGSAKANFASLMSVAQADYVLFVDADDVWKEDKVEKTISWLMEAEALLGANVPIYIFSDVHVADKEGKVVHESYTRFKKLKPRVVERLSQLLVCAPMLGCASGMNRALLDKSTPVPCDAVTGHDWWALLVAAVFGRVIYRPERTMFYRLHGENSSGPKQVSLTKYALSGGKREKVQRGMAMRRKQAQALLDVFGSALPEQARRSIESFVRTGSQGFIHRRISLLAGGYLYPDLPRNVALMAAG